MTTYQNANDRPAGVTSDRRLMTELITRPYSYQATTKNELAFTVIQTVTPVTGADVFFTLQNTDDQPLLVQEVRIYDALAAGEHINFMLGASYTPGGTSAALVAVNKKRSSVKLASSYSLCEGGVQITGHAGVTYYAKECATTTHYAVSLKDRPTALAQNRAFDLECALKLPDRRRGISLGEQHLAQVVEGGAGVVVGRGQPGFPQQHDSA